METFGGITFGDVIVFQTQLMMGVQFGRIKNPQATSNDILIACLRMGWNDAFRRASENVKEELTNKNSKKWPSRLEIEEGKWRIDNPNLKDYQDFICEQIINTDDVLSTFQKFAYTKSTKEKTKHIENSLNELKDIFGKYKKTDGNKQLCFGHFQKMFNIAIKLYICLYMCREYLKINDSLFDYEIINSIQYADCPIDSIILEKLSIDAEVDYTTHRWSKYGTDEYKTEKYVEVQEAISKIKNVENKSNLYYDFIAWKRS